MPFKSQWELDYPTCSLPTFVFNSPTAELPDTPVYIDAENPDHYLTLKTYRLLCQRLAAGLQNNGFRENDRLLLFSGNNIYFPSVFMGTVMAGGIFTGANPGYVTRELAFQLQNAEARILVCALASLDIGLDAAKQIGLPKDRVYFFDNTIEHQPPQQGVKHWSTLLASEEEGRKFQWYDCKTKEDMLRTIVLNYSSGTTGRPKGVMITHKNYVSNVAVQNFLANLKDNTPENRASTHILGFLPMYHAMAQTNLAVSAPSRGAKVFVMAKFDFVKMMDYIEKYKASHLVLVPPILVAMAKHPEVRKWKWDLSSVRDVISGAAPLGRPESELFESLWKGTPQEGKINVRQGWGMTELTCTATTASPERWHSTQTVGELAPGTEARIMKQDDSGEALTNERGEIWIRGPNVMKGYWRNSQATDETLVDGWLRTGDIAYVNEQGDFYIVDRIKELIKVKGNQVAPAELESLLQGHPQIQDVAVIGVAYQDDEAPRAFVVPVEGQQPSEKEIVEWMNKQVSKTKRLNGGVKFVDVIPKNPSGKILRRQLRDQMAKAESQQAKL